MASTTKENDRRDAAVVTRKLLGHVDNSRLSAHRCRHRAELTTPAGAKGVPVIIEFFPAATGRRAFRRSRSPHAGRSRCIARGWAYAILSPTSIQADNGAGLTRGIIGLVNKGQPRKPDDWGALRAWAWGASRALDYLETDPAVDAKRAVIEGRIALRQGVAGDHGVRAALRHRLHRFVRAGGAAAASPAHSASCSRTWPASGEYHWMAGNYIKYAGPLTAKDLPVDAHELIALAAPRPLFIGAGSQEVEGWVDPRGMFMAPRRRARCTAAR